MGNITRRSLIGTSLGLAAAGALARPYIANAAAKTAEVWWTQGFIPQEDDSFRNMVAGYEKASGNKINYSIMPFVALGQKMVSALQTSNTPDVIAYDGIQTTLVLNAWGGKLVDVSDVVTTQEKALSKTALLSTKLYSNADKKRAYYAVPFKCSSQPFHVWADLVEKAGYKMSDVPDKWDERWSWFKPMQAKLRDKGQRNIYALGLQMTTNGPSDGNNVFHGFLIANGGQGIVTPDGKEHTDDPQVREAIIKSIEYITTAYKQGYVPPGAISWNDADDNNGFHSKLILMDFDGTLSTELAMFPHKTEFDACATLGMPLGNDGKPVPAEVGVIGGMIPAAGKNIDAAKDFLRYVIEPKVNNEYLKAGLGRWLPVFPEVARSDPFWMHNSNPALAAHLAPYVQETILGPTIPDYLAYSPAYGEVEAQQVWGSSYAQVYQDKKTPAEAADWAIAQVKAAFAKYPIVTA